MAAREGQQLGNYRLVRLLGQGGFAKVYLGEHVHLNTQAAIKVLQILLADQSMEQFRNEARTIANLNHPNIIRVLDFGVEEGIPFLVMEYAANGTLRHRHPHGTKLSPEIVLPYVKQVALALQYAHDQKLIHRDVKPENMLLGAHNDILLSDFGLVSPAQNSRSQSTKEMAGTIPYMAPEQINGKPRPASDQYALGIVVYEWLCGERPFQGAPLEVFGQHIHRPPPPLRDKLPGISSLLEEIVLRSLAKNPQLRFANIQAFANAFEQAVEAAAQGSFEQQDQPTYIKPRLDQSSQSTFVRPPSYQSSQSTYIIPPDSSTRPIYPAIPPGQSVTSVPVGGNLVRSSQPTPLHEETPLSQSSQQSASSTSQDQFPPLPTVFLPPYAQQPPKRAISRRTVLLGLGGVLTLGLVTSTALVAHSLLPQNPSGITHMAISGLGSSTPTPRKVPTSASTPKPTVTSNPTQTVTTTPDPIVDPTPDPTPTGAKFMTDITGTWAIDNNGSPGGTLTINPLDSQGNFTGTLTFPDAPRIDTVQGSWNDAAGQITFVRFILNIAAQTFTGYLGNNHADQFIMLAGSFTDSGTPSNAARKNFGWVAQKGRTSI